MSCYVIQYKTQGGKWQTLTQAPCDTLAQAKEVFSLLPDKANSRIAEAHTVTVYTPVKEAVGIG